eukprot:757949-Hanusia_phi.AAC.2
MDDSSRRNSRSMELRGKDPATTVGIMLIGTTIDGSNQKLRRCFLPSFLLVLVLVLVLLVLLLVNRFILLFHSPCAVSICAHTLLPCYPISTRVPDQLSPSPPVVVGGPAHLTRQLARGDKIVRVEEREVTMQNIHRELIGCDVPGSSFSMTVERQGGLRRVVITRMAVEEIAGSFLCCGCGERSWLGYDEDGTDKRLMFEIFTDVANYISSCPRDEKQAFAAYDMSNAVEVFTRILQNHSDAMEELRSRTREEQEETRGLIRSVEEMLEKFERLIRYFVRTNATQDTSSSIRALEGQMSQVEVVVGRMRERMEEEGRGGEHGGGEEWRRRRGEEETHVSDRRFAEEESVSATTITKLEEELSRTSGSLSHLLREGAEREASLRRMLAGQEQAEVLVERLQSLLEESLSCSRGLRDEERALKSSMSRLHKLLYQRDVDELQRVARDKEREEEMLRLQRELSDREKLVLSLQQELHKLSAALPRFHRSLPEDALRAVQSLMLPEEEEASCYESQWEADAADNLLLPGVSLSARSREVKLGSPSSSSSSSSSLFLSGGIRGTSSGVTGDTKAREGRGGGGGGGGGGERVENRAARSGKKQRWIGAEEGSDDTTTRGGGSEKERGGRVGRGDGFSACAGEEEEDREREHEDMEGEGGRQEEEEDSGGSDSNEMEEVEHVDGVGLLEEPEGEEEERWEDKHDGGTSKTSRGRGSGKELSVMVVKHADESFAVRDDEQGREEDEGGKKCSTLEGSYWPGEEQEMEREDTSTSHTTVEPASQFFHL